MGKKTAPKKVGDKKTPYYTHSLMMILSKKFYWTAIFIIKKI